MNNKKILVTGGAGFIGSHLTRRLLELGAEVSVLVKYKSIVDNVRLSSIWDDIEIIESDLRNLDSLKQLKSKNYDIVFHLAAYNHVGDSFLHVNESLTSNTVATANLFESVSEYNRFVYTATSEVYGFQDSVPFNEEFMPFPISPYAIGKYGGELYARMKRHQTNKDIVCIRPFNTFGPYQSDRAIIPEIIIKCLRGLPVETTEGKQTREFNYIDNIIDGFIKISEVNPSPKDPINIGMNKEIAIRDLVKKIHNISNSSSELKIGSLSDRETEIWRMYSDNSKAKEILGWSPSVSFDEGLQKTIKWFEEYLDVYYDHNSKLNKL